MDDLLFLCQRIPYPPNKGEKIRAFQILRHLARRYRVHLGCLIDDPADVQHVPVVRALCAETHFAALDRGAARLRCLAGLATGRPLSLAYFHHPGLKRWTGSLLARVRPAVAFIYSSAMAQYLPAGGPPGRTIMDFVDVDSDKWQQYAERRPGVLALPARWLYRRESRTLLAFDRRVAARCDLSLFVSEPEAALFRRLAPESAAKTFAVANGIDADTFSPERAYPRPAELAGPGPVLAFTGTMDYWPNVDAVSWFAAEILPRIQAVRADVRFVVVGANPTAAVRALADRAGVAVTGRVADVRPYLAHADLAVAPIRTARGIQNKVLEGMAMAKPVVTTPQALEGIDAEPGRELILAPDQAAGFADAVLGALAQPNGIGPAARRRVNADDSWGARLAALDRLLEDQAG